MDRKNKAKSYQNFFNFLRDQMSASDMRVAALLTGIAVEKCEVSPDLENEHDVVQIMRDTSENLGDGRIFYRSEQDAFMGYTLLKQAAPLNWEEMLGEIDGKTVNMVHLPRPLIEQFKKYFESSTKYVLIAEGEKFTPNLKALVDAYTDCDYTITTMNPAYTTILERIFHGYRNVRVVTTSIYEYEFLPEQFDLILSVPAFGSRLLVDREQHFMCREHEMVALENLLLHLGSSGRLVILLPARITFAGGNVKGLRNFIQDTYKIESISAMPEGLLEWSAIKTYLLTITTGTTDDIAVRRFGIQDTMTGSGGRGVRSIRLKDETFSMLSELEEQGDWNVDKLFAAQDEDWIRYMGVKRAILGEVATVFRGKNVPRKDPTGRFGVVNISNLREYNIDYDGLDHLDEEDRKLRTYILEDGDILVPARGTAIRTAIFKKQDYPCIASSNLVVIRPRSDLLNSVYLKMFLDSPLGGKLLESAQQGTSVINLSYKDMQSLEIPLPEISKQEALAKEYQTELTMYLKAISEAESRWRSVLDRLQEQI